MKAHIREPNENLISEFSDYIIEMTTLRTLCIVLTNLKNNHGFTNDQLKEFMNTYMEIESNNEFDKHAATNGELNKSVSDTFIDYLKSEFDIDIYNLQKTVES
jgi:hypothetical protein